ncbi:peptidase domain-containing ABC transporter [Intestinirhabdus alba]|jgi:ATP-binding cassette subfamily B protein RaxB|uniref:ATP-binding cassette domain-containing protein n=1 Tax=Intestinirhabdus alba TaxID=2899544 RepID=A0A6L6IFS4_9ENTR|nr:peptidase domain-containing ABC transporter [Intestinirhabdus alba]MTH44747.1 ATP-binding cassette domain-containing protein [Intestinirhabdus alba]
MNNTLLTYLRDRLHFGFIRKVPQILQTESAECGLACLAMVCRYYGKDVDLINLRHRFGVSSHGATLGVLVDIADKTGLKNRPLSLDLDEVRQLKTPCILHWDMCHFVVLLSARRNKFVINDPAFGRRSMGLREFSRHFTGVALELWPDQGFSREKARSRLRLRDMLGNIHGLPAFLGKIFCFSLLIEAINLLLPVGTQLVMDHVIIAEDHSLLSLICIGLLGFILCRTFIATLRAWASLVMASLIDIQWKAGMFDHLMKLPLAYFAKRKLGDIQSRLGSLEVIRTTLTDGLVNGIIDTIVAIGVFIMMALYGGWLVGVVLTFTLIYMALRIVTYGRYRQASEDHIVKDARAGSHFMETLYGVGTIKALGITGLRAKFWLNLNIDAANARIRTTRLDLLFGGLSNLIGAVDQIIILWLGATMVIEGGMTLGMFVAFNAWRSQFSDRTASLINLFLQMRLLTMHNERIADVLLSEPELEGPEQWLAAPDEPVEFAIKDVSFAYDRLSKPIFTHLNIQVKAGESVAIIGPSGTGKTTLMKVMSGLLQPTAGNVYFNGIDINNIGLNNYRQNIACVLQDDKLFAGSIAENICSFTENKDYSRIYECAINCNIHDEIMQMPMGYETLIGELGGNLSGGQKQRLLIARALYRRPGILFLDEATSHLDLENEAKINQAIGGLNITRIFIAHRPSTIASAERVIDLTATNL